jgi:hypothetical protein
VATIGLRRCRSRGARGVVGGALVDILLGDGIAAAQRFPTFCGGPRHQRIGLCTLLIGAGLHQLLVELGRVDFGEHLACLDARADIDVPRLQIAADLRENRRPRIGFEASRQLQRRTVGIVDGLDQIDGLHRLGIGPGLQLAGVFRAQREARGDDAEHDQQADNARDPERTARWRVSGESGFRRHVQDLPRRLPG